MELPEKPHNEQGYVGKSLEVTIKVGLIIGLIFWCFLILKPFLMITLWGVIIAVAVYPFYDWLKRKLRNHAKTAAVLVTLLLLLLIMAPIAMLGGSLSEAVVWIREAMKNGNSLIPAPAETVKSLPVIGPQFFDLWQHSSENLADVANEYQTQLMTGLTWFLSMLTNAGLGLLMFIVSIIISGIMLVFSDTGSKISRNIAIRLMGEKGIETISNAGITVRNVARGILGVAFIQAFLSGIGFLVAGIPGAGLWALISFLLALVQIGIGPVVIGVLIYAFIKLSMLSAILLMIWCAPLLVIDNVLKPILLGRGAPVPMLVIFLGVIGGFISFGTIGLFVGAVALSLGYNLFLSWLNGESKTNENYG
ncbi:MAG: AI-2E family transporter [Bacteroidetes bacterium]|nr:AI-2E family transporter [Bacteroidota bacterium]